MPKVTWGSTTELQAPPPSHKNFIQQTIIPKLEDYYFKFEQFALGDDDDTLETSDSLYTSRFSGIPLCTAPLGRGFGGGNLSLRKKPQDCVEGRDDLNHNGIEQSQSNSTWGDDDTLNFAFKKLQTSNANHVIDYDEEKKKFRVTQRHDYKTGNYYGNHQNSPSNGSSVRGGGGGATVHSEISGLTSVTYGNDGVGMSESWSYVDGQGPSNEDEDLEVGSFMS